MGSCRRRMLLLLLPALLLAAFTALLVGPDGYFTVPGLVGLLPLAAAVLAVVLCAERPAVRPLPGRVAGVVYLLAGLACLVRAAAPLPALAGRFRLLAADRAMLAAGLPYVVIGALACVTLTLAAVCFFRAAPARLRGDGASPMPFAGAAALGFLFELVLCFLDDPVNSKNAVSQLTALSYALGALFLVQLFWSFQSGDGRSVTKRRRRYALLFGSYGAPAVIAALLLGGDPLRLLPLIPWLLLTIDSALGAVKEDSSVE